MLQTVSSSRIVQTVTSRPVLQTVSSSRIVQTVTSRPMLQTVTSSRIVKLLVQDLCYRLLVQVV